MISLVGHTGADTSRALLGSTAENVLRHARCDVLVVRVHEGCRAPPWSAAFMLGDTPHCPVRPETVADRDAGAQCPAGDPLGGYN